MQLQLLQVLEHSLYNEFHQLGQSSVKMFEASTKKKRPSSNHLGGAGQAELAAGGDGAKLSDGAHWTHGHLPRRPGTLTQQYIP